MFFLNSLHVKDLTCVTDLYSKWPVSPSCKFTNKWVILYSFIAAISQPNEDIREGFFDSIKCQMQICSNCLVKCDIVKLPHYKYRTIGLCCLRYF